MAISNKLNYLIETKSKFKDRLNSLGAEIIESTTFRNYLTWLDTFYGEVSDKTDLSENGIVGRTGQNPTLPTDYTRVDYIESSGTQYIDTGHYPSSNNDELEIQASYVGGNTISCLFGTVESNYYYYQLNKTTTANQFRLITYRGDAFYTFEDYASKHTYLLEGNKLYIDNTEVITGSGTVNFESQAMYLFARNNVGTPNQFGSWRIYSCKIKTNDILVRDFIPCYRNSDNVVGLYDLVNDVFYTNQGTGVFTYGTVVTEPNPDYPLEINNLSGDVEYKVRGKNKLPFPYTETSHTHNGITYTINDDGTVLVNGTATAQSNIKLYGNYQEADNKEPIGKYLYGGTNGVKIRALNHTGNSYTVLAIDTGNGAEIDTSVYKKYYIEISVLQGVTVNNVLIKPMVLDSLDDLKYEPYISESFPLSLKSKNLFDKDNLIANYRLGSDGAPFYQNGYSLTEYISVEPNTTYCRNIAFTIVKPVCLYDSSKTFISRITTGSSFTTTSETKYIRTAVSTDNINITQLEKGATPTDYEPYYDINLCNISDYKDQIYSQNGKFYLEKKTGKFILNGSEGWVYSATYQGINQFNLLNPDTIYSNDSSVNIISNYYLGVGFSNSWTKDNSITIANPQQSGKRIRIMTSISSTVEDFKTWLSAHNTEAQYVLATLTTTEITEENYPTLYSQLLAIQEFLTKYKINKEFLLDYSSPEIEY